MPLTIIPTVENEFARNLNREGFIVSRRFFPDLVDTLVDDLGRRPEATEIERALSRDAITHTLGYREHKGSVFAGIVFGNDILEGTVVFDPKWELRYLDKLAQEPSDLTPIQQLLDTRELLIEAARLDLQLIEE